MARGSWPAIFLVYGIGVLAAAQLGKFAALIPLVRAELAMSLTAAAWLASLIEAGGATMGLFAGFVVRRFGTATMLSVGVGLLALAGIGQGLAGGAAILFAWRLVESLGYLAIVVAAPTLIASMASPARLAAAMSLWSSFVPVGLALGATLGGLATLFVSWRTIVLAGGVIALFVLFSSFGIRAPAAGPAALARTRPRAAIWAISCGFGCYTVFNVGFLALLPTFLVEQRGFAPSVAGAIGGAASLAAIAGSAVAILGQRRGGGAAGLNAFGLFVPAALLFVAFGSLAGPWTAAVSAILLSAVSGIVPAICFSRLPALAGPGGVAVANGLFAQFGASGSMIGPPLFAACAGQWGWISAAIVGAVASVACLVLMAVAEALHARDARVRQPAS